MQTRNENSNWLQSIKIYPKAKRQNGKSERWQDTRNVSPPKQWQGCGGGRRGGQGRLSAVIHQQINKRTIEGNFQLRRTSKVAPEGHKIEAKSRVKKSAPLNNCLRRIYLAEEYFTWSKLLEKKNKIRKLLAAKEQLSKDNKLSKKNLPRGRIFLVGKRFNSL